MATNMTFVDFVTPVPADWLNNVNTVVNTPPITLKVVVSITALRALSKLSNSNVIVTGYYAAHDGGGGFYVYDSTDTTTADNGGTVIVASDGGRWKLATTHVISVKQFGATGNGTTDDTAAIQAAINSGIRRIYFPSGTYLITSTLNCTNLASTGVPLFLYGDAFHHDHGNVTAGTQILCRTGTWMVDFTGSEFVTMEDMFWLGSGTNASNLGFLYARSTLVNFAQNNALRRVMIQLPTAPSASLAGSIAVANNCAEQFVMDECWLIADTPLVSTLANEISFSSPYATIANTTFSNTTYAVRMTTFQAIINTSVLAYGLATSHFDSCVFIPIAGNAYPHAITLRSSAQGYQICANIKITGQVESFPSVLRLDGNTQNINLQVSTSNITAAHIIPFSGTTHQNLVYKCTPLNTSSVAITAATGAGVILYGGEICIPTGMNLNDINLVLAGTEIDGGSNDMTQLAVFQTAATSSYIARWVNGRRHFSGAWTPGGIASGTAAANTFTATGILLGDLVSVIPPTTLSGLSVCAYADSANVIRVILTNLTGSTITLGAGTWKFITERPSF